MSEHPFVRLRAEETGCVREERRHRRIPSAMPNALTTQLERTLYWPPMTVRRVEYQVERVRLGRHLSRNAVRQLLTDHAEYGGWELARLRRYRDGTRDAWIRRKIIRVPARTSKPPAPNSVRRRHHRAPRQSRVATSGLR